MPPPRNFLFLCPLQTSLPLRKTPFFVAFRPFSTIPPERPQLSQPRINRGSHSLPAAALQFLSPIPELKMTAHKRPETPFCPANFIENPSKSLPIRLPFFNLTPSITKRKQRLRLYLPRLLYAITLSRAPRHRLRDMPPISCACGAFPTEFIVL